MFNSPHSKHFSLLQKSYGLEYFKYDDEILNFSKKQYSNNYDFCFSYDMNDDGIIQKTAIFSIF